VAKSAIGEKRRAGRGYFSGKTKWHFEEENLNLNKVSRLPATRRLKG
jgi:hypothetical protein